MDKRLLQRLYLLEKKSVSQIAKEQFCSQGKVNYWLEKHSITKRSISDAIYTLRNPKGDPFVRRPLSSREEAFLFGLGLGLYWGEGTKANPDQVRLGNTDPYLVCAFLSFLQRIYNVKKDKLRFALQIFSDMDVSTEQRFWQNLLQIPPDQFYKTIVTQSGKVGTYRNKSKHGVLTVYFNNKKLRDALIEEIEKIKEIGYTAPVR